ncbi:hypothetical protein CEK29_06765 [Bordetella genomosp. 5]|uniref:DUF418 domain-containing protein n=1 Tax=Bordetella genomosp. 5 TaxID=1395608 RepID=UPI000B9E3425|nr:DUF418 domain-containing protein [Bordetella genomosp. 5]OZI44429.1 hypothetical protein CEK29_06765 [Bordetella genomosp. 5]
MPLLPDPTASRLTHLDALRGFALFGILLVNINVFASTYYGYAVADPNFDRPLDGTVLWTVAWLFETKFYLLFSFLFGYSFSLQLDSAARAGVAPVSRLLRRFGVLVLLGLIHAFLFYHGDILVTYGVLALILLACRDMAPARALNAALFVITLASLGWLLLGGLATLDPQAMQPPAISYDGPLAAAEAYRGTIGSTIAQHARELIETAWFMVLLVQGPYVLAMFLAGLALGRRGALVAPWQSPRTLGLLVALCLPAGLAGAAVYASSGLPQVPEAYTVIGLAIGLFTAPLLSLSYAGVFFLVWRTAIGPRLLGWLAPMGRMALSNYLMQSVVCAFVFTAWGLRLVGTVSPLQTVLIALAIFAAQAPWSAWWLRHHEYGPVEWLLRAATYARRPVWRRRA